MPVRTANAVWNGTLKEGNGNMKFGGGAFDGQYSFSSRFEEGAGTNPEELIGAAHAGCYSMALSAGLTNAGFPPQQISTEAKVLLEKGDSGFTITKITLNTEAQVAGIDEEKFQEIATATKSSCPISRALAAVQEIVLNAKLVTEPANVG